MKKVRMIKSCLMLIFIMLTVSCAMGKFVQKIPRETIEIVIPKIGKISECSLREEIIKNSQGYYADGIIIKENIDIYIPLTPDPIKVKAGFYEHIFTDDRKNNYYYPSKESLTSDYMAEGYGLQVELIVSKNNEVSVIRGNGEIWTNNELKNTSFEVVKSNFVVKENSFQQTLIYLGKVDNNLKFSYREFYNNIARDSFTTEISYDLSESSTIGYKNFKAEIINATNSKLTYKIISGF